MRNRDLVLAFLKEENYKYEVMSDTFLKFKSEGVFVYCYTPLDDAEFIQFFIPRIYSLSDHPGHSRETILSICNELSWHRKTLKCVIKGDDVFLLVDLFIDEKVTSLLSLGIRALAILSFGLRFFYGSLEQIEEARQPVPKESGWLSRLGATLREAFGVNNY